MTTDYLRELGFELVTVTQTNGIEVHLIRDDCGGEREATLTERVLWHAMLAAAPEASPTPQAEPVEQAQPVAELVALELERLAQDPPISGNHLAQARVRMAAANVREFGPSGVTPPPKAEAQPPHPDTARLDFLASEYCHLTPFTMPTGADDADVGWMVRQEHMGKRGLVTLAAHYDDDLRAAIDAAIEAERGIKQGGV